MKKLLILIFFFYWGLPLFAQVKKVVALPITGYVVKGTDSIKIVQVSPPDGMWIEKSTAGILRAVYTGTDSAAELGRGRCHLIKGRYYYFGITKGKNQRDPKQGDLMYTSVFVKNLYDGLLFNVVRHNISITSVEERKLADLDIALSLKDAAAEQSLFDSLVYDVQYTAKAMMAQNSTLEMVLQDGLFKGKKLFTVMQAITNKEVKAFLKYITARPDKYAGNTWKFSEIFATWLEGGTPTVQE